jgi:Glutathione S-transferase
MRFYYAPGACSIGIHILLEEVGAEYDAVRLDLWQGEQRGADYLAVNPKGKVPTLVLPDGEVLTEFPAIAYWIAQSYPEAGLWPATLMEQVRVLELVDYLVATVHMRGFTLAAVPQKFCQSPEGQAEIRGAGQAVLQAGVAEISARLEAQDAETTWLLGAYSIADAVAFYILDWVQRDGALPATLAAYDARLRSRPAVQRALRQEAPD